MSRDKFTSSSEQELTTVIHGACAAIGPETSAYASIEIVGSRISCISKSAYFVSAPAKDRTEIDLTGYLLLPGLINAHDHLEFALYPRLGDPPYRNYIEWGEDIHKKFADVIARHHTVPKNLRLWWGGLRNLLCGVTTVCHHNPLWPELRRDDFPVRVVQEYGWAHSFALGGDLRAARSTTPKNRPFIVHACEGVDDLARAELSELDRMDLLDVDTVLVHGLALDSQGVALMNERGASLIVCPSSNHFLFGTPPDLKLLRSIKHLALGNDSPLTATGDLLDEIRFAIHRCKLSPREAYRMVTTAPAEILHLCDAQGSITEGGIADLVAVRHTGSGPCDRLQTLSMEDIQFVMIGGRVQLASEAVLERLPPSIREDLQLLVAGAVTRWLCAPVTEMLREAEKILGKDAVRLRSHPVRTSAFVELAHVG
jgi:cytosine/adenosine deaminase-related metal-dependent hydrolase